RPPPSVCRSPGPWQWECERVLFAGSWRSLGSWRQSYSPGGRPPRGPHARLESMNPLIGVSTSVTFDRYPEPASVNAASVGAVQQAGGIPVLLPPQLEPPARAELLKRLQGVLLTGGGDVDPTRFGEAPHPTTADVSVARDGLEVDLTRWAIETRTPLLAICRGLQVLNVALAASLPPALP